MARLIKITGAKEIKKRLQSVNSQLSSGFRRGLIKAGLFLQWKSQAVVPVHLGNLKNTAGTRAIGSGWDSDVIVFYTSDYAVYVHERTDALHGKAFNAKHRKEIANAKTDAQKAVWFNRGVNQKAKFLEEPARDFRHKILRIIAGKVKGIK